MQDLSLLLVQNNKAGFSIRFFSLNRGRNSPPPPAGQGPACSSTAQQCGKIQTAPFISPLKNHVVTELPGLSQN